MSQQIRQLEAELGRVAIGFIGSATCALLPKLVRHLRATLPDIDFEAHLPGRPRRLSSGAPVARQHPRASPV